jgi:ubiquinone/menaquinone biosynthesis C-methylase UbiE
MEVAVMTISLVKECRQQGNHALVDKNSQVLSIACGHADAAVLAEALQIVSQAVGLDSGAGTSAQAGQKS